MSGAETLIQIKGLCNRFADVVVHDGLDLTVKRGEILGVVGGSGAGKSVLLRSIVGLQPYAAGEVTVLGHRISREIDTDPELQRRVGVMFQDGALFTSLTVLENVMFAIREHYPLDEKILAELAHVKIVMAGLNSCDAHLYPRELSGGMRKRAGLARALALDPELLFLDEPTSGLDPITAAAFDKLLVTLRDALDLTVFLVTHDLDTLYRTCDRVAVLADRRVLTVAPLAEVAAFEHPWVQAYFHGPRGRAAGGTRQ